MININKILFVFIISLFCLTKSNALIQDSIFATVGNKAITHSDIINEIKILLIMSGQQFTQEKKIYLEKAAINSSIKRKIKEIEIEKYGNLTFNQNDVNKELNRMANKLNLDLENFKKIFASNNINFSNVIEQIQIELLWNSLIYALYKDRLSINLTEIEEQLKFIHNKANKSIAVIIIKAY